MAGSARSTENKRVLQLSGGFDELVHLFAARLSECPLSRVELAAKEVVGIRPEYRVPRSKNRIDGWLAELGKAGRLPIDPDSEMERVSVVLDLDEHYPHRKLDERIGVFPDEARAAFAYEVALSGRGGVQPGFHVLAAGRIGGGAAARGRRVPRTGAEEDRRSGLGRAGAADPELDAGRTLLDEALAGATPGGNPPLDSITAYEANAWRRSCALIA